MLKNSLKSVIHVYMGMTAAVKGSVKMRLVPINCVKEGTYLAKPIYDSEGRILLAKGVVLTDTILKKVELNGILSLYIIDEYSDNEIDDIIKPELRQRAIDVIKSTFSNAAKSGEYLDESTYKLSGEKVRRKVNYKCMEQLIEIVDCIVEEVLSAKDLLINLVDIKNMDDYTYQHCVNVVILSLVLGAEMNLTREQLSHLGVGAMLHDMGKVFVPKEILTKKGRLTPEEFKSIKEHPTKGYEYLKDGDNISAMSKIVILQHHERIDGTGYPQGIKGKKIHQFARITSITDVYDALTSDRSYRRALPPSEAIEYLMGGAGRHFDFEMVKTFIKRIVPYPVGTLVKLSTGDIAVVEEVPRGFPLRPKVKIVKGRDSSSTGEFIDMMQEKNIVIDGIQYEI